MNNLKINNTNLYNRYECYKVADCSICKLYKLCIKAVCLYTDFNIKENRCIIYKDSDYYYFYRIKSYE